MLLAPNQVHIWHIDLDRAPSATAMLCAELSRAEQDHARHIRLPQSRDRWLVAHGALRCILASYLNAEPAALTFRTGTHGKPELIWPAQDISFNLAHSRDTALLAVTASGHVGIDLEHVLGEFDFSGMMHLFFAGDEVKAIAELPPAQQRRAFFVTWTRKEAFAKAVGSGLSMPFNRFIVTVSPDQPARFLSIDGDDPGQWSLVDLSESAIAATLAVRMSTPIVQRMRFPDPEHEVCPNFHLHDSFPTGDLHE